MNIKCFNGVNKQTANESIIPVKIWHITYIQGSVLRCTKHERVGSTGALVFCERVVPLTKNQSKITVFVFRW